MLAHKSQNGAVRCVHDHLLPHRYVSASVTDAGCVRPLNEDACLNRPEIGLWAVADGMGGHDAGDFASQSVIRALETVGDFTSAFSLRRAVRQALFRANYSLYKRAEDGLRGPIGSTVVVLMAHGGHYACTWAGDSRAYVLRQQRLRRITTDHSITQHLVSSGVLLESQRSTHPQAHVVTRAVGASDQLELDGVYGCIEAGDRLLLCSDGLVNLLTDVEIADVLGDAGASQAAAALVAEGRHRGAPDNITCVVVDALDAGG